MKLVDKAEAAFVGSTILISLIVGVFWTMVFYPAIVTTDGWSMWGQALHHSYMTWFPPAMPMLMHATLALPHSLAFFSFLQSSLYTFSLLVLLKEVVTTRQLFIVAAIIMLGVLPPLWLYQVTLFNNVWVATFTMLAATLLMKAVKSHQRRRILLASLCLAIAIAFRHEALFLLIIPIVILQFFYAPALNFKQLRKRFLDAVLILFISLFPGHFIENLPTVEIDNKPSAIVLINQYFGTLHYAQQKAAVPGLELANEQQSFDQVFGTGMFNTFLSNYNCAIPTNRGRGKNKKPFDVSSLVRNQSFVVDKVKSVAFRYPIAFLHHRLCNLSYLLQIPAVEYYIPEGSGTLNPQVQAAYQTIIQQIDGLPTSRFPKLYKWFITMVYETRFNSAFNWLYRHYLFIGLAGVLLILSIYLKNWAIAIPAFFSIIGLTPYLIIDGHSHSRYLLPSYIFSWVTIFAFLDYIYCHLSKRFT